MDAVYEAGKALIIGGLIAIVGYFVWRRQLAVQHSFDLARRILINVFKVRASIKALRASLSTSDPQQWEKVYSEAAGVLWTDLIEAEAVWGDSLNEPRKRLNELVGRYWMKRKRLERIQSQTGVAAEKVDELEKIVWEQDEGADKYGDELNAVVGQFESALRPKLIR
jgi:hypothetical protein